MSEHSFSLLAFPNSTYPEIQITGSVARARNVLTVHYALSGSLDLITFPAPVQHPGRKGELWTSTCLEFFVALPDQPRYWEFNLSPSGDWNIYRMEAYRRIGFREEPAIRELPFSVLHETDCVLVDAAADLSPIIATRQIIQVGITSVIQNREGTESYWALAHPEPEPDFHVRNSFSLELEG